LLDIHGQVIGINTAIKANFQNIGFAIPVDVAKQISDQLISKGSISHPFVGISMVDLTDEIDRQLGLKEGTKGVLVAKVVDGSPAQDAGLQQGDIVRTVDGQLVKTPHDVQDIVHRHKTGDSITFVIGRNGESKTIKLTIGDYPGNTEQQE
jgi:S1-C subfamily serine protease